MNKNVYCTVQAISDTLSELCVILKPDLRWEVFLFRDLPLSKAPKCLSKMLELASFLGALAMVRFRCSNFLRTSSD